MEKSFSAKEYVKSLAQELVESFDKALNAGKLKDERVEKFEKLLAVSEQYRRKNQYE